MKSLVKVSSNKDIIENARPFLQMSNTLLIKTINVVGYEVRVKKELPLALTATILRDLIVELANRN